MVSPRLAHDKPQTTRRKERQSRLGETDSGRMNVGRNASRSPRNNVLRMDNADLFHRDALRGFGFINMQMATRAAESIYSKQSTWPNASSVCVMSTWSLKARELGALLIAAGSMAPRESAAH